MSAKAICFAMLVFTAAGAERAFADWKIYFVGDAVQWGGSEGRGSFATKDECEKARLKLDGFLVKRSYSKGFDSPSASSDAGGSWQQQAAQNLIGAVIQSAIAPPPDSSAQDEINRQNAIQQQKQREEQQRAAQVARMHAASQQRALWDGQDSERQTSLAGSFDVPLQGTAFFGIRPNPSSAATRQILDSSAPAVPNLPAPKVPDVPSPELVQYQGLIVETKVRLVADQQRVDKAEAKMQVAKEKLQVAQQKVDVKTSGDAKASDENDVNAALKMLQEATAEMDTARQAVDKDGKELADLNATCDSLSKPATPH